MGILDLRNNFQKPHFYPQPTQVFHKPEVSKTSVSMSVYHKPHLSVGASAGLDNNRNIDSTGKRYGLERTASSNGRVYEGKNHFHGGNRQGDDSRG
jgi:hypothetical protein